MKRKILIAVAGVALIAVLLGGIKAMQIGATRLLRAFRSALAFRRVSGASLAELLRSGLAMRANQRLTRAQMLMAANAPILAKTAMQDGDPVHGYLPSGSVAGRSTKSS